MMSFFATARELATRANPDCPHCKGAGWYLRVDRAPMACECTRAVQQAPAEWDEGDICNLPGRAVQKEDKTHE